ncbi:hypothetical protein GDO86_003038 [Hymenochirus boettgeri]|uniref:BACK domain-containing protein n=1 Tax=Hymenochirus boettgeri TaxID=247094 RepID=A0A8T2K4R3_9PIPI|nr:hypothetical protein GDO86_003038 [Hymenochirus boettgeri]
MLNIIKSDDIPRVSEQRILHLVLRWLHHGKVRLGFTKLLFENVRFGLLPLDTLRTLYTQTDIPLTASIKCMIIKAINYHSIPSKQPLLQGKYSTMRNQKGWIMLVGGTSSGGLVDNILGFDVYSHRWRRVTTLHLKVQHHCICVIGNFLYVIGGETLERSSDGTKESSLCVTNVVYRYDPRFDQWVQVSSMLQKRAQFSCCIIDNYIFAIGGRADQQTLLSSVEFYDINRDTWTTAKELPCKMHGQASAVHNNTIYISGGKREALVNSSKDVYSFNRLESQWKKQAPMTIARFGHKMATVRDVIFTFLGIYEPFSDIEKYDPNSNQWTRLRPLPFDRFCYGLVVVEQTVLLLGGKKWQDSQEVPTQNIVGYDTENDCWEEICSMAVPLSGLQCSILHLPDTTETDEKLPNLYSIKTTV